MSYTTDALFQCHFPKHGNAPLLALGMLQWGTTPIDQYIINGSRGVLTEDEAEEIFCLFRSRGVVLFDTAEGYGGGTSELRLGRLWRSEKKRSLPTQDQDAILMTKFLPVPWRWTHKHFELALRASNKRMGISECPIYLLHSPMHLTREIEYWVESAAICKKKGLMKFLGLSNCSADEVRRAWLAGKKYGVDVILNQVHFSLLDYNSAALKEMQSTCNEYGVTIVAYNSLGQGLLTDTLTEERIAGNKPAMMMRIQWSDLVPLRSALQRIANAQSEKTKKNISMAQVALNWCRAHNTIPLVGCRSKQQAADTLSALDWSLTCEQVEKLDSLALSRCTLDSPRWRRKLFVVLAGVVMTLCRWMDDLGWGRVDISKQRM
jgi:aryl-alcohol dehydrogenase-like predicted oxidoreductase